MCSSVDLPAPDGPMIDTNSPSRMSSEMRRSRKSWPAPWGIDFSTSLSEISAPGFAAAAAGTGAGDGVGRLKSTLLPPYRIASVGCTRAARRAGTMHASSAAAPSSAATIVNVSGSRPSLANADS